MLFFIKQGLMPATIKATNLLSLVLICFLTNSYAQQYDGLCPDKHFPRAIGHSDGSTHLNCLLITQSGDTYAGGSTSSTYLNGDGTQTAVVVKYDATMQIAENWLLDSPAIKLQEVRACAIDQTDATGDWKVFLTESPLAAIFIEADAIQKYYMIDDDGSSPFLGLEPSTNIAYEDGTVYFGVNGVDPVEIIALNKDTGLVYAQQVVDMASTLTQSIIYNVGIATNDRVFFTSSHFSGPLGVFVAHIGRIDEFPAFNHFFSVFQQGDATDFNQFKSMAVGQKLYICAEHTSGNQIDFIIADDIAKAADSDTLIPVDFETYRMSAAGTSQKCMGSYLSGAQTTYGILFYIGSTETLYIAIYMASTVFQSEFISAVVGTTPTFTNALYLPTGTDSDEWRIVGYNTNIDNEVFAQDHGFVSAFSYEELCTKISSDETQGFDTITTFDTAEAWYDAGTAFAAIVVPVSALIADKNGDISTSVPTLTDFVNPPINEQPCGVDLQLTGPAITDQTYNEGDTDSFNTNTFTYDLTTCSLSTITYSAQLSGGASLPACLDFDINSRLFDYDGSCLPSSYDVQIIAETDGIQDSTSENFNILTVGAGTINHAPTFVIPLVDQQVGLGGTNKYQITFSDINAGDTLSLTIVPMIPAIVDLDCQVTKCVIEFRSSDPGQLGTTTLTVTVTDDNSVFSASTQSVVGTFDFTLTSNNAPFFVTAFPSHVTIPAGDVELFTIPTFGDPDPLDILTVTVLVDGAVLPGWIFQSTVNPNLLTFLPTLSDAGIYEITVIVTDNDSIGTGQTEFVEESFTLIVTPKNHAPYFTGPLVNDLPVQIGAPTFYLLPAVLDLNLEDSFTFQTQYSSIDNDPIQAKLFSKAESLDNFMEFAFEPWNRGQVGSYTFEITVSDDDSVQSGTVQTHIDAFSIVVEGEFSEKEQVYAYDAEEELSIDEVIADLGLQKEDFTEPTTEERPIPEISSITEKGLVTISFDQEIYVFAGCNLISYDDLEIRVKSNYDVFNESDIIESWEYVNMTSSQLVLQVNFVEPKLISGFKVRDRLQVKFLRQRFFISIESFRHIEKGLAINAKLPPQQSVGGLGALSGLGQSASAAMGSAVAINLAINGILNLSISLLWTMMNTLQIIVHIPLVNIRFPENAKLLSLVLFKIANFDILPHEWLTKSILGEQSKKTSSFVQQNFQDLEYGSLNFIENAGSSFYFILIWCILALATLPLKLIAPKNKYIKGFTKIIYFGFIIRVFLEVYLDLVISAFMNLKAINFNSSLDSVATLCTLCVVPIMIMLPFVAGKTLQMLKKGESSINDKKEKHKEWFSLFRPSGLGYYYNVNFMFRRLIFGFTLVFFSEWPVLQLALLMTGSCVLICFSLSQSPFKQSYLTNVDVFNESTILFLSYLTWGFTDHIDDPEAALNVGWVYCTIILLNILLNLVMIIYLSIYLPVRAFFLKKQNCDRCASSQNRAKLYSRSNSPALMNLNHKTFTQSTTQFNESVAPLQSSPVVESIEPEPILKNEQPLIPAITKRSKRTINGFGPKKKRKFSKGVSSTNQILKTTSQYKPDETPFEKQIPKGNQKNIEYFASPSNPLNRMKPTYKSNSYHKVNSIKTKQMINTLAINRVSIIPLKVQQQNTQEYPKPKYLDYQDSLNKKDEILETPPETNSQQELRSSEEEKEANQNEKPMLFKDEENFNHVPFVNDDELQAIFNDDKFSTLQPHNITPNITPNTVDLFSINKTRDLLNQYENIIL